MGYNVYYTASLWLDTTEPYQVLSYNRGRCGWVGDKPPPDHEGEGLFDNDTGEFLITIEKNGQVNLDLNSEKFYTHYMTRLLKLLKARFPSLRGYVSCDHSRIWTVTDEVVEKTAYFHDVARHSFLALDAADEESSSNKRARKEPTVKKEPVESPEVVVVE